MAEDKPKKTHKNFTGRPRAFMGEYDIYDPRALAVKHKKEAVYMAASWGASMSDIGRLLNMHPSNIRHYRKEYEEGQTDLKMRVRLAQIKKAMEGDPSLLKHLGVALCEEQKNMGITDIDSQRLHSIIEQLAEEDFYDDKEPKKEEEKNERD